MNTEQISVRIDSATKSAAEGVFHVMGLSATDAIRMFYRQVALRRGLPFPAVIPNAETIAAIQDADASKGKKTSLKEFKALLAKLESEA